MLKFEQEHTVIKSMSVRGSAESSDGKDKMTELELGLHVEVSDRMWKALETLFPGAELVSKHCASISEEEGAHGDVRSTKRDLGAVTLEIGYGGKNVMTLAGSTIVKTIKLKTLVKPAGHGELMIKTRVKVSSKQLSTLAQYVGADITTSLDSAQMDLLAGDAGGSSDNVVALHA